MSLTERPTAAFVLSLVAGLIILLGGAARLMFRFYWFRGMMRGFGRFRHRLDPRTSRRPAGNNMEANPNTTKNLIPFPRFDQT
jgi:hypothetical protein